MTPELLVRGATTKTAYKARDEQRRKVVRAGLTDVEDGVDREGADEDRPSTDELRAGTPEGGTEHEADEEEGEYEVAYFPPDMEITRNNRDRRRMAQKKRTFCLEGTISWSPQVATTGLVVDGDVHVESHYGAHHGEPPFVPQRPVLRVFRVVRVTRFGSVLGLGRKGVGGGGGRVAEDLTVKIGSSPPKASKRASSCSASAGL
jgi:hypothetical protein